MACFCPPPCPVSLLSHPSSPTRHTPSAIGPMSSGQSNPKTPPPLAAATSGEAKARGANRSTKVAGKLKVLPEHAEPVLEKGKVQPPPAPPTSKTDETGEGSGTLADSEDDEGDEEEEPDDAEVRRVLHPLRRVHPVSTLTAWPAFLLRAIATLRHRCIIRSTSFPPGRRAGMRFASRRRRRSHSPGLPHMPQRGTFPLIHIPISALVSSPPGLRPFRWKRSCIHDAVWTAPTASLN